MRLLLYDFFIWVNFLALFTVFWNQRVHEILDWLVWVLIFGFGGLGSWLGLFLVNSRKRNTQTMIALVAGILQVLLLQDLIGEFLFTNF